MSYLEATVYGCLQGLTEFLPVSSSAHLALTPWLLGWKDQGLSFDVALHLGTLAALLIYFRRDWLDLITGALADSRGPQARLLAWMALATVPAAAAGLIFEKQIEALFRDPSRVALSLIVFGLLMEAADRLGRKEKGLLDAGGREVLGVGLAQALALMPGVSRSGVTITAALALGLKRDAAARFSFLLGSPIILGAGLLKIRHLEAADLTGPFLWAVAVSALSGLAAVRFFIERLGRTGLTPYTVYRVIVGVAILVLGASR